MLGKESVIVNGEIVERQSGPTIGGRRGSDELATVRASTFTPVRALMVRFTVIAGQLLPARDRPERIELNRGSQNTDKCVRHAGVIYVSQIVPAPRRIERPVLSQFNNRYTTQAFGAPSPFCLCHQLTRKITELLAGTNRCRSE